MVKVYGPMMSLDASGTLADTITFSKWKGRNYVRERVIPSNPKSGAQTGRRAMFKFLSQNWAGVSAGDQTSWQTLADELVASPFNAYMRQNMANWHNFLAPSELFSATRGGTPSDNALTAAVWEENRIKLTFAGSNLNDYWGKLIFAQIGSSITESVGLCIIAELETTIASHDIFWTPPSVATWFFDSITFSDDGAKASPGGEQSAAP
jgi:hypothetical protein